MAELPKTRRRGSNSAPPVQTPAVMRGTKRKSEPAPTAVSDRALRRRTTQATRQEAAGLRDLVEVVDIRGKGKGVRAKRRLEPGTFVGVLPGFVYGKKEYNDLARKGLVSNKYAIDGEGMRKPVKDKDGELVKTKKGKVVMEKKGFEFVVNAQVPGSDDLHPDFAGSVGHFMNEPGKRQRQVPVSWVHNYAFDEDVPRLELYTNTRVPRGRELTIHYGKKYDRRSLGYSKPRPNPPRAHSILPSGSWENPDISWEGGALSAESDTTLESPTSSGGLKAGSKQLTSTGRSIRAFESTSATSAGPSRR